MAFESCQNCSTSASNSPSYLRFDCGMPILTSGTNTILSSSNLSLRDWSLELAKHSLSNMKLQPLEQFDLSFEHSLIFIKTNGPIRIQGALPNIGGFTYDLTIVDSAFINFGQKFTSLRITNEQDVEYEVSVLLALSKGLI